MKGRAENDVLKIEPDWEELVKNLNNEKLSSSSAKIIIYGLNTPQPLPPGTILSKVTSKDSREVDLPLPNPKTPNKILKEIQSEFNEAVARKIEESLGENFVRKESIKKLRIDSQKAKKLKYGGVPGVSGSWKRTASGGTWTIYANLDETKVLKAPHAADSSWESAILALTHETVAEVIEKKFGDQGLKPPGDHSVIVTNVEGSKVALAIMDYEKNYVTDSSRKGLERVQEMLREMYEAGELPTHEFDYRKKGLEKRRNLAYKNGNYVALDLCDKSVLDQDKYLEKHGIPGKARKLGFSRENDSNSSGLLSRFL